MDRTPPIPQTKKLGVTHANFYDQTDLFGQNTTHLQTKRTRCEPCQCSAGVEIYRAMQYGVWTDVYEKRQYFLELEDKLKQTQIMGRQTCVCVFQIFISVFFIMSQI